MDTVPLASLSDDHLRTFYETVMLPCFPTAELMTYSELATALRSPGTRGLASFHEGKPVAGIIVEDFLDGRVVLLAYLAATIETRGKGIGTELMQRATAHEDRLVLAEIEDPRFHSADQLTGDPVARVRFYDRYGSCLVPIPYCQPALRAGSPRVENLLLITIPSALALGSELDGGLIAEFLDEYYSACEGEKILTADQRYAALRRIAAAEETGGRLRLSKLTELEAARATPAN